MKREPGFFHLLFLLVAFTVLFMYGRTAFLGEGVYITGERHEIFLGSHQGKFDIGFCPTPHDETRYAGKVDAWGPFTYVRVNRHSPRSMVPESHFFDDYDEVAIQIPHLIFFFTALALPLLPVMWRETKNRFRNGPFCPACDYSLAGTASGSCPECGQNIRRSHTRPGRQGQQPADTVTMKR